MDDRTRRFLDAAKAKGWLEDAHIDECVRIYDTVREVGVEQPLEDILAKKGYLTPDQIRLIRRELATDKVGKYQILEKLGEGGAGIVYKANQEPLERVVAVKVLSKTRAASPEYLERFSREARIAVTLNHQNIVRGLDYGEAEGYHYFVMEYVEGQSLYEILTKEGVLEEKRALDITLQTVHALQHAAKYDLVHRDVKPENILITPELVAKLCDLGLAKPSLVETAQSSTDGTTIGTPTYMSPEQIRGKDDADFRADVYSLGITLYHMVGGRPPFEGESADIVVRKHIREAPLDPRELNPKVSSSTAAIIMKMIAKKPEDRYASLDDLEEDIESVLAGRPPRNTIQLGPKRPAAKMQVDLEEGHQRRARAEKKKSVVPLLVVVLLLAGAGVAAMFVLKPGGDETTGNGGAGNASTEPVQPTGPDPEDEAEDRYRQAQTFINRNPDASLDAKKEMFELVVRKHPDTRWAVNAKEAIRKLEAAVVEAARAHEQAARDEYNALTGRVDALLLELRYGEAVEELRTYPAKFGDTEFPARLARREEELPAEAAAKSDEILKEADRLTKLGRYKEAEAELLRLDRIGIDKLDALVAAMRREIVAARESEAAARAKGREIFRAVVGAAYAKAAVGEYRKAEEDLVLAADREDLAYFRNDLDSAWRDLREAVRFERSLSEAGKKLTGSMGSFDLLVRGRKKAAGRVLGATGEGLRMVRGTGEEVILFRDIAPSGLVRLAFEHLDLDKAEDHRAAALYLIVHGHLDAARSEIDRARILGADTGPVTARLELVAGYLGEVAEGLIKKAEVRRIGKQYEEARAALEAALVNSPRHARARFLLGAVLVEMGSEADGEQELLRARELGFADPEVDYFLAVALEALDRPEEALAAYGKFVESAGDGHERLAAAKGRVDALRNEVLKDKIKDLKTRARNAFKRDRWSEAIDFYEKLYQLAPAETESLYYVALSHLELKDYLSAYLGLSRFLEVQPTGRRSSDAKRQRKTLVKNYRENLQSAERLDEGRSEYNRGNYPVALELFNKSIQFGPLNTDAYFNRAMARLELGKRSGDDDEFEKALADFDVVRGLAPDEFLIFEGMALAYYYLERNDEALASARTAIEKLPKNWSSYNIAGLVLHNQGKYEEAVKVLTQGLKREPMVPLSINRALAFEALHRYDEAESDLSAAVDRKPVESELQQISRIRSRIEKAREREE